MGFRKLTLREQEIVLFQASLWFGPGAVVERKLAADFGSLRVFLEVTTPHSEDAIVGVQANSAFANLASANPNVRLVEKQEDADIGIQILILVDRKDVVVTGYVGSMVIVAPLKMRSVLGKTDHIDQFVGHAAVRASTIEAVVSPLYAQANVSQILPGIKYLQTMKESMEKSIPKN